MPRGSVEADAVHSPKALRKPSGGVHGGQMYVWLQVFIFLRDARYEYNDGNNFFGTKRLVQHKEK